MTVPDAAWDPTLRALLEHMAKIEASDLYLAVGSPPVFRIDGVGRAAKVALTADQVGAMADSLMDLPQRDVFREKLEMNLALQTTTGNRFRANMFFQRGAVGMVVRLVRTQIKTIQELQLPSTLEHVMASKRGLVLVVGGTGSGKSTTLAAMIDHRNRAESGHIITVEDPIEFLHTHQSCVVNQREVGIDTRSYGDALKNALRQAPDVILIGEVRDAETMEAALAFAETGHLCVTTLHANNANQAIERVLNFFPTARHHEIKLQLSMNLRAVISQRLVVAQPSGRAAALEILLDTPRIKDLIKRGEIDALKDAMDQGHGEGCQTFDTALFQLVVERRVTDHEAMRAADSPNNLRLRIDRHWRSGGLLTAKEAPLRLVGQLSAVSR